MSRFILIVVFFAAIPAQAIPFPRVPTSSRILTADEVQNYWFNTLRRQPFPRKPSSLYPRKQASWESAWHDRKTRLLAVLDGRHQSSAQIAALEHNINAYLALGDTVNLKLAREELHEILEHRARLATLDAQKSSANRVADAAERTASAVEVASDHDDCPDPVHIDYPIPCPVRTWVSPPCPPRPSPPSEPTFPFPNPRPFPRGS